MLRAYKKWLPLLAVAALLLPKAGAAQPAQEWALEDAEGNAVRLSDFRGDPLILHFWASWCPFCKKLQPGLDRLYRQYREQGVQLIGINFRDDEDIDPQAVLEARGHHFKTLVDGGEVAERYGVKGTPTTILIDSDGNIVLTTNTSDPAVPRLESAVKFLLEQRRNGDDE